MRRLLVLAALAAVAVVLLLVGAPGLGAQPNNSEQIVFSGTGFGTFNNTPSPFGFWIWCEGDSGNPYEFNCAGSMYFYFIQDPAIGVFSDDQVTELGADHYKIHVNGSSPGISVSCDLTNSLPLLSGPKNTVTVSCTSPSGGGVSTNSVVKVTGP